MGSYCSCQRSDINKQFFRDATAQVFWVVRETLCLAQWYGLWVDLCSVDLLRPQKLHCVLSIAWNRKTIPWKLESVESRRGQGIWGAEGMLFKPRQRPNSSSEQQHAAMIREPGVHPWRREGLRSWALAPLTSVWCLQTSSLYSWYRNTYFRRLIGREFLSVYAGLQSAINWRA